MLKFDHWIEFDMFSYTGPDDGCPFCSTLYATEAHADVLNYCQCNNDVAVCMPCGCGTKFDAKMGCCMTDLVNGRKC